MLPNPTLPSPDVTNRQCAVDGCHQPPCFRTHLERPGRPVCGCAARTADACAEHVVDVIHDLAQWAKQHCPHPADVTVYAADRTTTPGTQATPPHGFAFTTIRVPG